MNTASHLPGFGTASVSGIFTADYEEEVAFDVQVRLGGFVGEECCEATSQLAWTWDVYQES